MEQTRKARRARNAERARARRAAEDTAIKEGGKREKHGFGLGGLGGNPPIVGGFGGGPPNSWDVWGGIP